MSDIDAILRELGEIDQKLEDLPADAFDERITLRSRHEELRQEAAQLAAAAADDRPTSEIQAELGALRHQLQQIEDGKIDVVVQSGGGSAAGPGAEGLGAIGLNQQIEAAQGADEIRGRIEHLRRLLEQRGVDSDA